MFACVFSSSSSLTISNASLFTSQSERRTEWLARRVAVARPMPDAAPVTTTTLLERDAIFD
jgi:hypothetical protein